MVARSDRLLEGRRQTAVPVRALLADSGFREVIVCHLGSVPALELCGVVAVMPVRAG